MQYQVLRKLYIYPKYIGKDTEKWLSSAETW